jgi:predicted RNA binding protein YcfA (HicA-like mRNA interferase family)
MPKLRRLTGTEVIKILAQFGFEVIRIKGSHHLVERIGKVTNADGIETDVQQILSIPVHGHKQVPTGTLRRIYRDSCRFIDETELKSHFYSG